MNNNIITIENKKYKRIDKRQAKRIYNNGGAVIFCPCNLKPFGFRNPQVEVTKNPDTCETFCGVDKSDFEKVVNAFTYYNCINSETGKYTAFYVEV